MLTRALKFLAAILAVVVLSLFFVDVMRPPPAALTLAARALVARLEAVAAPLGGDAPGYSLGWLQLPEDTTGELGPDFTLLPSDEDVLALRRAAR